MSCTKYCSLSLTCILALSVKVNFRTLQSSNLVGGLILSFDNHLNFHFNVVTPQASVVKYFKNVWNNKHFCGLLSPKNFSLKWYKINTEMFVVQLIFPSFYCKTRMVIVSYLVSALGFLNLFKFDSINLVNPILILLIDQKRQVFYFQSLL